MGVYIYDISPKETTVDPGARISFDAEVCNQLDEPIDYIVKLIDHNGDEVDSANGTLDPYGCTTHVLNGYAPTTPGTYTWTIIAEDFAGQRDSTTVAIHVKSPTMIHLYINVRECRVLP